MCKKKLIHIFLLEVIKNLNLITMSTRQTRQTQYLRTRSGKRYARDTSLEDTYTQPVSTKRRHTGSQSSNKKAKTESYPVVAPSNEQKATLTIYHPDNQVEVKVINYDEWKTEVLKMLQETLHMTQEELEDYPFFEWFLNQTEPSHIANHIRRDFFRDEDEFYLEPFQSWQREVDNLLYSNLGINRLDLPDFPFYDHFHNMDTPLDMFQHMRRELYL